MMRETARDTARTWAEISLGNLEHNYRALRACAPDSRFLATVKANGYGHGALAEFLRLNQVDSLICGGIGGGAQNALAQAGIQLYGGVTGEADGAVEALLAGKLGYDPDVHCDHHGHGHGDGAHNCGHSSCSH